MKVAARPSILSQIAVVLLLISPTSMFGACHAVGPTSAGSANGSSWTNRQTIPATLVRGDTYYLMDGSYSDYVFASLAGSTVVTVKKAQSYDFGRTSDGCSNDISSGWNAATMGASQASFNSITNHTNFVTFTGNGQSTTPGCGLAPNSNASGRSDCGIFVGPGSAGNNWPFLLGPSGDGAHTNWTIQYVEVQGGNTPIQEEDDFMCWGGGCNTFLLDHVYDYNSGCVFFKIEATTGFTIQNSYIWKNYDLGTGCHGQMWLTEGTVSGLDFHNNIVRDITGTAVFSAVSGGAFDTTKIYNNVFTDTNGSSDFGTSNGTIVAVNSSTTSKITNTSLIGNTWVNMVGGFAIGWKSDVASGNSITIQNNLLYNSDPFDNNGGGFTLTESNNSCLGTSCGSMVAGSDVKVASSPPNPFVNWPNGNFNLVSANNADWNNGLTESSPFNVDLTGAARPGADAIWNRGAFEFFSGQQAQSGSSKTGTASSHVIIRN